MKGVEAKGVEVVAFVVYEVICVTRRDLVDENTTSESKTRQIKGRTTVV
jgi:hypothetical protein